MRKVFSATVIVFVLFVLAVMVLSHKSEEGFRITVHNHLDQPIPKLVLVYPNGSHAFSLDPRSDRTIHVVPKNFGEGSITLQYEDNQTQQKIMVFGYIENGYRGKAVVSIDSVAENGELQVTVKQEDKDPWNLSSGEHRLHDQAARI